MSKLFSFFVTILIFNISFAMDNYIVANHERHFRVILKHTQEAIGLHYWDKDIKYHKLLEIKALVTFNCDKKLNEQKLDSIAIYQLDFATKNRLHFLDGTFFIIAPPIELPLKNISMMRSINLIYPIFNTSVAVSRYKLNGFWFKIIDAAGWANKYNIRLDIKNGDEEKFQNVIENIVEIEDREYQKICPYF